MELAFDITDRGYRIKAWWGDGADAKVIIEKDEQPFKEFGYPAYKIFNLAAHFRDIVDGFIDNEEARGFAIAGSDGLGCVVVPDEEDEG